MDYVGYIQQIMQLGVIQQNSTSFQALIPGMIDYAEQRIYRDLQLLATTTIIYSPTCTVGQRTVSLPASGVVWVTIDQVCVITPASASTADTGTRNPLRPTSLAFINAVYPVATVTGVPQYYAKITDQQIAVGPWPDAAYHVEFTGTTRPAALSSTNTSTWITVHLPDLFIAASMVYVAGYQRDFGAQADDPKLAQSWETQYQNLKASADTEEAKKKYRI